jgi:quercetin dioxygenase-like cupin family protein
MVLDSEELELHQGVVVYVPRGVKHKAKGNVTISYHRRALLIPAFLNLGGSSL